MKNILEFKSICKSFPGVKALDDISFVASAGQVHALIGQNGAGKSTLIKILGGVYKPTSGELIINNKKTHFHKPLDSMKNGVAIIHQELQLVDDLTVAENIFLGRMPTKGGVLNWKKMNSDAEKALKYLEQDISPKALMKDLSIGQKQMVEIAKAISLNANIIAFDEPTSSLSEIETVTLFKVIAELQKQNKIIFYVSHRMAEIFQICNSCTVMKDGKKIVTYESLKDIDKDLLITKMTGREIKDIWQFKSYKTQKESLSVDKMFGYGLKEETSFKSYKGEILGFFGLVGAGRSELLRLIYGASHKKSGSITLDGKLINRISIKGSITKGLMFLSEDRKLDGIIPSQSIIDNNNISSRRNFNYLKKIINPRMELIVAKEQVESLKVKTPDLDQLIENLSGGNQQKVLLGRWLSESNMKVLIIDEPTRGIDVSAKNEIYNILYRLAQTGVTIIIISSELPEAMGITDRLYVMREGTISAEFNRIEYDENKILSYAFPQS